MACEQSLMWRSKPSVRRTWLRRLKRENWMRALFTRTYIGSRGTSIEDWWTSSLADSRASHSHTPGSVKVLMTHATCGPPSLKESTLFDQPSVSLRTSMASPPQTHPDTTRFSTMSSATWKKWVIDQRQDALVRRKLERPTSVSDGSSSAWPTPTGIHADRGNHDEPVENYQKRVTDYEEGRAKGKPGKSLGVAVNWPTPMAHEPRLGFQKRHSGAKGCKHDKSLITRVIEDAGQHDPDNLSTNGNRHGSLNPAWVEILMGFPTGWTDSEVWGTQWSPMSQPLPLSHFGEI